MFLAICITTLAKLADSEFTQNAGLPGVAAHPVEFRDADEVPCLLLRWQVFNM